MGVSGSGKTSVGRALSDKLGCVFYDGDDFHSPSEVEKMSKGKPLNDEDRAPWLEVLRDLITAQSQAGESIVVACSALKKKYRQILRKGNPGLVIVYLEGDFDLVWSRMQHRSDHFMKPEMLKSQFDALEIPANALQVNIDQPVTSITEEIIDLFELENRLDADCSGK